MGKFQDSNPTSERFAQGHTTEINKARQTIKPRNRVSEIVMLDETNKQIKSKMKHKQLWKKQLAIFQIINYSNKYRVGHDAVSKAMQWSSPNLKACQASVRPGGLWQGLVTDTPPDTLRLSPICIFAGPQADTLSLITSVTFNYIS